MLASHPLLDKHGAVEFGVVIPKVFSWAAGLLSLLRHNKSLRGMAEAPGRSGLVATGKGNDLQAEVLEGHPGKGLSDRALESLLYRIQALAMQISKMYPNSLRYHRLDFIGDL